MNNKFLEDEAVVPVIDYIERLLLSSLTLTARGGFNKSRSSREIQLLDADVICSALPSLSATVTRSSARFTADIPPGNAIVPRQFRIAAKLLSTSQGSGYCIPWGAYSELVSIKQRALYAVGEKGNSLLRVLDDAAGSSDPVTFLRNAIPSTENLFRDTLVSEFRTIDAVAFELELLQEIIDGAIPLSEFWDPARDRRVPEEGYIYQTCLSILNQARSGRVRRERNNTNDALNMELMVRMAEQQNSKHKCRILPIMITETSALQVLNRELLYAFNIPPRTHIDALRVIDSGAYIRVKQVFNDAAYGNDAAAGDEATEFQAQCQSALDLYRSALDDTIENEREYHLEMIRENLLNIQDEWPDFFDKGEHEYVCSKQFYVNEVFRKLHEHHHFANMSQDEQKSALRDLVNSLKNYDHPNQALRNLVVGGTEQLILSRTEECGMQMRLFNYWTSRPPVVPFCEIDNRGEQVEPKSLQILLESRCRFRLLVGAADLCRKPILALDFIPDPSVDGSLVITAQWLHCFDQAIAVSIMAEASFLINIDPGCENHSLQFSFGAGRDNIDSDKMDHWDSRGKDVEPLSMLGFLSNGDSIAVKRACEKVAYVLTTGQGSSNEHIAGIIWRNGLIGPEQAISFAEFLALTSRFHLQSAVWRSLVDDLRCALFGDGSGATNLVIESTTDEI